MEATVSGIKKVVRETKRCGECGRDIDVRGFRMHQEKHQRDMEKLAAAAQAGGKKPPNGVHANGSVVSIRPDVEVDPVVKAFELGFRIGLERRRVA